MDDGCGIPAEEVPLAFQRHATSKLTHLEDLYHVLTLGFRGEALASIAAVSRLTLVTRPAEAAAGTRIRFEGGEQVVLNRAGSPGGTIITVENLFYNVPARLKFLKATATEAGHIHRIVSHYALAYPHIRFSLQTDQRTVLQTTGRGDLVDALVAVFGAETAKQMGQLGNGEPVPYRSDDGTTIYVSGYAGTPALHRGSRDQMIFFVNRRWIQDRALNQAIVQAYHTFLPVNRYPIAVINIDLDPSLVDVNVHPTKAEVKFQEPRAVFQAVQRLVRAAVVEAAPIPSYEIAGGQQPSQPLWSDSHQFARGQQGLSQFGLDLQRADLPDGEQPEQFEMDALKMPPLRVVGQIQQMYIITEGPDGLYLIDQHAAHERILYEKLTTRHEQSGTARQQLLDPTVVELTPGHAALVEAEQAALASVGFELEAFGGTTYRIRAVPDILGQAEPSQALVDILAEMSDGAVPLAKETHEKIAITVCKRASIKGGQMLSHEEMHELVRQLEATTAPRTCPHGRPTMIHLSASQLARQFGRH